MGFHYEKPSALLPIQILTTKKKKKKKKKEEVERIGIEKETLCFEGRQTTNDPSISRIDRCVHVLLEESTRLINVELKMQER